MLAERRKRVSYNLNPKTASSDDTNSFGKRMLEKMGWKPGGGVGANLQGIRDFVKVRWKLDNKGVGYRYNDPYCVHQTSFESVLSELNNEDDKKLDEEFTLENSGANSLELKSKRSRVRVHYKKFTRGKDISNYSSKDLECILGKKVKEETVDSSTKFCYGGNSTDYFKTKLESKSNVELIGIHNCQAADVKLESGEHVLGFGYMKEIESVDKQEDELRERKSEKILQRAANKMESCSNNSNSLVNENIDTEKKMEKCRAKENVKIGGQGTSLNDDTVLVDENLDIPMKKRRKKNSTMEVEDSSEMHVSGLEVENTQLGTKKDKKRKLKKYSGNLEINLKEQDITINDCEALTIDEHFESTILPQQKKKRKKSSKNEEESEILRTDLVEDVETAGSIENNREMKNCKKKKRKQQDSECSGDLEEISDVAEKSVKKRKAEIEMKNKRKQKENEECQTCVQESSCSKRKKKNKHSDEHVGIFDEDKISSNDEVYDRKNKRKNRKNKTFAEEFDEQNIIPVIEDSFESVDDLPIYKKKQKNRENNYDDMSKSSCIEMKTCISTKHINEKLERRKSVTFSDKLEETFCFNTNKKVASNAIDLEDSGDSLKIETIEVSIANDKNKKKKYVKKAKAEVSVVKYKKNRKQYIKDVQATEAVKQHDKNNEHQVDDMINLQRYFVNLPCKDMTHFDFGFKGSNIGTIKGYGN